MRGACVGWLVRGKGLLLVAAVAGVLWVAWPTAQAGDERVQDIVKVLKAPGGMNRRLALLEELRQKDTTAARQAIADLTDSGQDRLAVLALATLGRVDTSSAKSKLETVAGSGTRSDFVRSGALLALAHREKRAGRSWSEAKSTLERPAASNQKLLDVVSAARAKLWKGE